MTLSLFVIGPLPEGTYAVGYPTPVRSVMTIVATGMTQARAQAEANRLNQEQEKCAESFQRDRELRMRPEMLRPVCDYLVDIGVEEANEEA